MATAGSIVVDLLCRTGSFETDTARAAKIAEKRAKEIQNSFEAAGNRAKDAFAGIFAGLTVGATVAAFKSVVNQFHALNDVADATGASIEKISGLEDIGKRTGAGLETVETALIKLNQAINAASDPKSSQAAALDAIGLSAKELAALDPADAIVKVAQALDGYADDGNKARLAQELLGKSLSKSLKELAPFLKDVADKGQLNATVTAQQAAEAERFNNQIFELQTNINGAARTIVSDMLPALTAAGFQFSEQTKQAGLLQGALAGIGELAPPLRTFFETVAVLGVNVAYVFQQIGNEIGGMAAQIAALLRLDFKGFAQIGRDMKADAEAARKDIDALSARILDRTRAVTNGENGPDFVGPPGSLQNKKSVNFSPFNPKPTKPPKAQKEYDAEYEMSRRAAEEYAATLGKIIDAQDSANDSLLTLTPSQKALRELMADPIWQSMPDPWKQQAIAQTEAAVAAEKMAKDIERLNALLDATPTAQLEKQRETMRFLADAFERGAISAQQFSEAAQAALGTLPQQTQAATDSMTVFTDQAARNMQDAFANFLFDPFNDGLEGMALGFAQTLQKMASEMLASKIFETLGGALKNSETGWVSQIGNSFLAASGNKTGQGGTSGQTSTTSASGDGGGILDSLTGGLSSFWRSLTGADNAAVSLATEGLAKSTAAAVSEATQVGIKLTAEQQATGAMLALTSSANSAAAALASIQGGSASSGIGGLGGLLGGFLGAGGGLESIANFLPGDSLDNYLSIAGMLADGGPATAGKTYLVGERGPELFTPNTSGRVLPNDLLGKAGGAAPVVQSQTRIINAIDPSLITDHMGSAAGERVIVNVIKNNPGLIRSLAA